MNDPTDICTKALTQDKLLRFGVKLGLKVVCLDSFKPTLQEMPRERSALQ